MVLVNAIGAGAVNDKLVYRWVPEMIERYLGEEPILQPARSYDLTDPESRRYVLDNLERMVIKPRGHHGAGSVSVVPDLAPAAATRAGVRILEHPQMLMAQECLDFSQHMVLNAATGALEARYVDLRGVRDAGWNGPGDRVSRRLDPRRSRRRAYHQPRGGRSVQADMGVALAGHPHCPPSSTPPDTAIPVPSCTTTTSSASSRLPTPGRNPSPCSTGPGRPAGGWATWIVSATACDGCASSPLTTAW